MDAEPRLPREIGRRMDRKHAPSEAFLQKLCETGLARAELQTWFTADGCFDAPGYSLTSRVILWQQRNEVEGCSLSATSYSASRTEH